MAGPDEGPRYKHPEAGNLVTALFEYLRVRTVDPRTDLLLNIGILLGKDDAYSCVFGGRKITIERNNIVNGDSIYAVSYKNSTVFDAAFLKDTGLIYGIFEPGDWMDRLSELAESVHRRRKTEKRVLVAMGAV